MKLPFLLAKNIRLFFIGSLFLFIFFPQASFAAIEDPTDLGNLKVWYDATDVTTLYTDAGCTTQVTSSGSTVKCWQDKSANADHAIEVTGMGLPQYMTNQFNGQSVLEFNKAEGDTLRHELSQAYTSNFTFFIVMKSTDATPAQWESFFSNAQGAANDHFQIDYGEETGVFQFRAESTLSFAPFNNETNLYAVTHNGTTVTLYSDGAQANSANLTGGRVFEQYRINENRNGGMHHDSQIAEIILYDDVLTACELEQVNEYLSVKYGSDFSNLAVNYGYGDPHDNDIAALGEFSSECGGSTEITSAASSIATLSNPSTLDVDDYLTFAHNAGAFTTSSDAPGDYERINRSWRVDVDNSPGTVTVTFNLANVGLDVDAYSYVLLKDTDTTFSNATTLSTGHNISGDTVSFTGINFSDGDYFTVAFVATTPAPEFSDIMYIAVLLLGFYGVYVTIQQKCVSQV